jgi:hypothetical protein
MSASSSASDSAFWFRDPAIDAVESEAPMQTASFVVLHIAIPGQDRLTVLRQLRPRRGVARVLLLAVCHEERKELPIQIGGNRLPRKIWRPTASPRSSWINAVVWTLLAGCCAITLFFALQAPFRLGVSENQASTVKFRSEVAALPVRLAEQTMSRLRPHYSHRVGGYDKEGASDSSDDSLHKRRLPRERLVQKKQSRVGIQAGQISDHR